MEQYRLGEYLGIESREIEQEIIALLQAEIEKEELVDIARYEVFC